MNRTGLIAKGALAAGVLVASLALAGCFPNPLDQINEQVAKGGAEKLIEDMTGGDVDVDLEGGKLPEDFPADIPTPDGTIAMATKMKTDEGTMWMVRYEVGDAMAAAEDARQMLLADGWEEAMWTDGGGMLSGMFGKGDYAVNITAMGDDEEQMFSYNVIHSVEGS